MNGKIQISHVKNETTYNIPLVLDESVISSGISLISLWHTLADESYRVIWPQDKKKPLIANSWVAVYTVQGCGKIRLKDNSEIMLNGNNVIFLKPTDITSYYCDGLIWEQYWMEFIPTNMMEIPILQTGIIYNGDEFNKELSEVAELLALRSPIKNNLAVAFLTKIIYQWICLISENGRKDRELLRLEICWPSCTPVCKSAGASQKWHSGCSAASPGCGGSFYDTRVKRRKNIILTHASNWRNRCCARREIR